MKISKKGFTLTEIIIVVAIIVIISGAAIAGVAVTIAQANERGEQMYNLYGEGNWEKEANATIAALKPTLGDEKTYEADVDDSTGGGDTEDDDKLDPNATPDPDPKDPDPKDPDPKDPDPKDPDPKDPDPKDPDPKDPDPITDPEPDPVVIPVGPSYGDTGRPSTGTTTYAANDKSNASNASVSIGQAGDQYNNCQINTKIPNGTKTYVVYVDGASSSDNFSSYNGTVTNLGDGYYRVTLNYANCPGEQLYSTTCKGVTGAYVVEYSSE